MPLHRSLSGPVHITGMWNEKNLDIGEYLMKLYDDPRSGNGYKARLLLAHVEQPYQYIRIDILRGESRTKEFLHKNLNGRIPVLELDDGSYLPESNAILCRFAFKTDPGFALIIDPLNRLVNYQYQCITKK